MDVDREFSKGKNPANAGSGTDKTKPEKEAVDQGRRKKARGKNGRGISSSEGRHGP